MQLGTWWFGGTNGTLEWKWSADLKSSLGKSVPEAAQPCPSLRLLRPHLGTHGLCDCRHGARHSGRASEMRASSEGQLYLKCARRRES